MAYMQHEMYKAKDCHTKLQAVQYYDVVEKEPTWSRAFGLPKLGGLAVGPLGRPAASPGFTLLGRSSLLTLEPGRSKARSPTCM